MGHQVVNDDAPVADTDLVHLEVGRVKQKVKHLLLPGLAGVLVPTQTRQHLGARPEAWQVVRPRH